MMIWRKRNDPQNLRVWTDAEQAIWQENCVPCTAALLEGRLKAGLTKADAERLFKDRTVCSRAQLPVYAAQGFSAALLPSAALSAAKLAGIVPVVSPGFRGEDEDIDALALYDRLLFCAPPGPETEALLAARNIPLVPDSGAAADAWLIQRELGSPEGMACAGGSAMVTMCAAACEAALALKVKTDFQ